MLLTREGTTSIVKDPRTYAQYFINKMLNVGLYLDTIVCINLAQMIIDFTENKFVASKHFVFANEEDAQKEIKNFCNSQGIDIDSSEIPYYKYKSINEFFTRKLKPDLTPFLFKTSDKHHLVSMADCRMVLYHNIKSATNLWIKGYEFDVKKFIGIDYVPQTLEKGSIIVHRLAPSDYHRYHAPFDMKITNLYEIPSSCELSGLPVTIKAVNSKIANPFTRNARIVIECTHIEDDTNIIYIILIGAIGVQTITHTIIVGNVYKKYEDIGCFEIGGSCIVMLFPENSLSIDNDIFANSVRGHETYIKVGEKIGRFNYYL